MQMVSNAAWRGSWQRWTWSFTALSWVGFIFGVALWGGTVRAQTDHQPNSQPYGYNSIPERDAYAAPSQKPDASPSLATFELAHAQNQSLAEYWK